MAGKILLVLLLVGANGFFVAAEFALVKIRLSEIRASAESGSKPARMVVNIVEHLDAYLSACQLGITLASLGLGWVGEPLIARSLEPLFRAIGLPEQNVHYVAFPVAFTVITFLHITVGEQVPKIMAIHRHKSTSFAIALPLAIFYKTFKPFIWVLNESSNLMLRLIGIRLTSAHETSHSEDELRFILLDSALSGHVSLRERFIMENVLDLEEKTARGAMLPRNRIVFLDRTDPIAEQMRKAAESGHTRLPLCDEDLEHTVGIIHVKDVFKALATGERIEDLTPLAREAVYHPETMPLDKLMRELQRHHIMMTLLVDEHGVVSGLITFENVIEELVGQIQDEFDSESPLIVEMSPNIYEIDAACGLDSVRRRLAVEIPDASSDTIGGAVVEAFGRIPESGETVVLGSYLVTVLSADERHVTKIRMENT
ncbi:MAG: HlyC/CorC family transporter [Candidatus Krumholzibacteria bacterium]|nr:HlyC/CorC family transporter [Candidatus Krumholzibacteria bacterium]